MKKWFVCFCLVLTSLEVLAQNEKQDSLGMTVIKENPITSVKNQNRSGTCWDFATVGFFEGEILRKTGRTYDLCEMFVANKNYVDEAIFHVRLHGDSRFSEGGSAGGVEDARHLS